MSEVYWVDSDDEFGAVYHSESVAGLMAMGVEMGDVLREWTEKVMLNEAVVREQQIQLVVRSKPRWLPKRLWKWALNKLLFVVESGRFGERVKPDYEAACWALVDAHAVDAISEIGGLTLADVVLAVDASLERAGVPKADTPSSR